MPTAADLRHHTHTLGKPTGHHFSILPVKKLSSSSNHLSKRGYDFQLYMMNADGSGTVETIAGESIFNAFPKYQPDGKKLSFSSNRNNGGGHDTNVFVADWVN